MTLSLHHPLPLDSTLERINFIPGRALGEEELEAEQTYLDARLRSLAATQNSGIVTGLEVRTDAPGQPGQSVTITPGLAVGGDGRIVGLNQPLTLDWAELIDVFQAEYPGTAPRGVYYLVLSRTAERVDVDQDILPSQRFDLDRYRDSRRIVVGRLSLRRLMVADALALESERAANLVCAMHANSEFLQGYRATIPLALVGVDARPRINWMSIEAGRLQSAPHPGYDTFRNHTARLFEDATAQNSLIALFNRLRFLPAAGVLPTEVVTNIDTANPGILHLPNHLRIDMVPIRATQVDEVTARHLPRGHIDLANSHSGDHLRLLLALPDELYAPDILDIPAMDGPLVTSLYDAFVNAHESWVDYKNQFFRLYSHRRLAPERITELGLPAPQPRPQTVADFHTSLVAQANAEAGAIEYPYDQPLPAPSASFVNLLNANGGNLPTPTQPGKPGLVVSQALKVVELERLDNQIRAKRKKVETLRDYQLLQRQQLDAITVSMASLAGGVSGDGSGLQVARWLPYAELKEDTQIATDAETPPARESTESNRAGEILLNLNNNNRTNTSGNLAGSRDLGLDNLRTDFRSDIVRDLASEALRTEAFSTFELSFDRGLFGQLARLPSKTITAPAFKTRPKKFGVLEHIRPDQTEYQTAYDGLSDLLVTLDQIFDPQLARKLQSSLEGVGKPTPPNQLPTTGADAAAKRYRAIFKAGRILTQRIAFVEDLYGHEERLLESWIRKRARIEGQITQLSQQIRRARARLNNLLKTFEEAHGDYGQAQRLLDDNLQTVRARFLERNRILTEEVVGLHYVRAQSAPLSARLDRTLRTRITRDDDLVPGCPLDEDAEMPDSLQEFFDALLEIGISNWVPLRGLTPKLPPPVEFPVLRNLRRLRADQHVQRKKLRPLRKSGKALLQLASANDALVASLLNQNISTNLRSKARTQARAARVISMQDVLAGGYNSSLRRTCETLRTNLEQACVCLLEQVETLPPARRFRWAQLAEDDRLDVSDITRWPGFRQVRHQNFLTGIAIHDLLEWWFRQLTPRHSSNARAAARNMIRAIVIHAALGDPEEILQGQVLIPPRVLNPGALIRVRLNRPARLGTKLQLFDEAKRAVALVRVEDDDDKGVTLTVMQASSPHLQVTKGFTVAATNRLQWRL